MPKYESRRWWQVALFIILEGKKKFHVRNVFDASGEMVNFIKSHPMSKHTYNVLRKIRCKAFGFKP